MSKYKGNILSSSLPVMDGVKYTGQASGRWNPQEYIAALSENKWVKALSAPDAPTLGAITAGNAQVIINFTAPADTGGVAITGYTAVSNPGNLSVSGASSPLTLTGLTNGTSYTVGVSAVNSQGTGVAAYSTSFSPTATLYYLRLIMQDGVYSAENSTWKVKIDAYEYIFAFIKIRTSTSYYPFGYTIHKINSTDGSFVSAKTYTNTTMNVAGNGYNKAIALGNYAVMPYSLGYTTGYHTNLYIFDKTSIDMVATYELYYSSTGSYQAGANINTGDGHGVDNNYLYLTVVCGTNASTTPVIIKLDTNFNIISKTISNITNPYTRFMKISGFTTSHMFIMEESIDVNFKQTQRLKKINKDFSITTGNLIKKITADSSTNYGQNGVQTLSDGTTVFAITSLDANSQAIRGYLVKLDSNFNIVWSLSTTASESDWVIIGIDTSNNIYIKKTYTIIKLNSSGVMQWARTFGVTSTIYVGLGFYSFTIFNDKLLLSISYTRDSTANSTKNSLIEYEYPLDGSKIGSTTVSAVSPIWGTTETITVTASNSGTYPYTGTASVTLVDETYATGSLGSFNIYFSGSPEIAMSRQGSYEYYSNGKTTV